MQSLTHSNPDGRNFPPETLAFLLVYSHRRIWLLLYLAQMEKEGTVEAAMRTLFATKADEWRTRWLDRCLTRRRGMDTVGQCGVQPSGWMQLDTFCALLVTRVLGLLGAGEGRVEDRWLLQDDLCNVLGAICDSNADPLDVPRCLTECVGATSSDEVRALGLPIHLPPATLPSFPHCQDEMTAANRLCWYFKPERVQQVLAQYKAGEVQLGDERYYRHYHIRPVQFHGLSMTQEEADEMHDQSAFAWRWVSFDVIDAEGRELPFTVKYRGDDIDAPCCSCKAEIRHRENLEFFADAQCYGQEPAESLLMIYTNDVEYAPHRHIDDEAEDMEDDDDERPDGETDVRSFQRDIQGTWISQWRAPFPEQRELAQLLIVALGLAYFHPSSYESSPALYSDNQPLDVRRLFTRAAIERTEEAERILALPAPLVDAIVEWALVDLPYVKDEWSEEDKERMYVFCTKPEIMAPPPTLTAGARPRAAA